MCATSSRRGEREEASPRYVNPKGKLTQYDKVMIVVVGFFGSDAGKVQPKDEQRLTEPLLQECP